MHQLSALTLAAALGISGAVSGCSSLTDVPTERVGSTSLKQADGKSVGNAQIFASETRVVISAAFFRLPSGPHAVHLHTTGQCDGPDFKTAGGHLNPGENKHGSADGSAGHLGDLPNVTISPAGTATYEAVIEGSKAAILADIFDEDGAALMVHEGPDDYRTDPSGGAGGRIACGVLKPA
ncbi:superoxide dismutase family protein [Altererythrobacter sp. ZODW24]|uniref:superoxide dismutase family protein n=1 Tax=Altererythrobacter sp. ZODW24 TaxID=2185142 RepID=UPI000DF7B634|nr:superoxide dismutase family protein [Altererythrobacter sp. ZODW24]